MGEVEDGAERAVGGGLEAVDGEVFVEHFGDAVAIDLGEEGLFNRGL